MSPMDALTFLDQQVKPRVFNGKLDEAVQSDWMRSLQRPQITKEVAQAAIQEMVDAGTPFKVASFYKALRRHSKPVDAVNSKPVLLYSLRFERSHGSYTKGFYAPTDKSVPTIATIVYQARRKQEAHGGSIVWAENFVPDQIEESFS